MANLTVTVAVSTGTQYITGNTSSIFTFDGSQPASFTFPWVASGTVGLEQSGSSNDGHPLIFSTSNSTVLATMRAGIISSGVTYYLDGSSNQSDYTNTTTFNAATTRYIEIAPSTETDFYFACWVHGISMGGIMDITQDTWGALTWGEGLWGQQGFVNVSLTGVAATTAVGNESSYNLEGWGRDTWGSQVWGGTDDAVTAPAGIAVTTSVGSSSVELLTNVAVTGVGLTSSAGNSTVTGDANISLTGLQLNWTVGPIGISTRKNVEVPIGVEAVTSIGSNVAYTDVTVSPTGLDLTASLGTLLMIGGIGVQPTGQALTSAAGSPKEINADANVTPLAVTLGIATGNESITGDTHVFPTGVGLTGSTGILRQASGYPVVGQSLTSSLGTLVPNADAHVFPTGVSSTISVGIATVLAYNIVDTGTPVSYSETSTGTDVTYTEVAA